MQSDLFSFDEVRNPISRYAPRKSFFFSSVENKYDCVDNFPFLLKARGIHVSRQMKTNMIVLKFFLLF